MIYVILAIIFGFLSLLNYRQFKKYEHIPGPPGIPLLGNTIDAIRDHQTKSLEWANKYGPVFKYKILFWYFIVPVDLKALKHVMVTSETNYTKNNFFYKAIETLMGENIVDIGDIAKHHKLRTSFTEAFTYQSLRLYFPIFVDKSRHLVDVWKHYANESRDKNEDNAIDIMLDLTHVSLDTIGRVAFACDFNCTQIKDSSSGHKSKGEHIHELIVTAYGDIGSFDSSKIPGLKKISPAGRAQKAAAEELAKQLSQIIDKKRETAKMQENDEIERQRDLLDIVVGLKDENGQELTTKVIYEQSVMFMVAGLETCASALTFILYLLAKHPAVQDKVVAEIRSARDTNMETLDALVYLNCVIKESLRLYPPGVVLVRKCEQTDTVCGIEIPGGTTVIINPYAVQNADKHWDKATQFIPERWHNTDENTHGVYIPFLLGSRNCIGNKFALLQVKAVLAVVLPHFRFSIPPGFETLGKLVPMPALRAVPDIKLTIRPRED